MTLWGGAFSQPTEDAVRQLNDSYGFDWRLYDVDITGSIAWARALARAGILTVEERDQLVAGLARVREEFRTGVFGSAPGDEDIHTAVERRLGALVGPVAGKLHTGRSRNDQVATDLLLWLLQALDTLSASLAAYGRALVQLAERYHDRVMPGYTHFQPAQPVTAGHWLLSHFWPLTRDVARLDGLAAAWRKKCPLGSGALAGTPYAIDRDALARDLGFEAAAPNSLDAVADRDHAVEFLFAAALIGAHLSRIAEDVIIFANPALGFVTLDERYSTGSSLMPQKRNPDPMELARGKAGRLIGNLTGLLTTLKGLPSGYNKDLQEDKEPLFDTFINLQLLLAAMTGLMDTLTLNPAPMRAALNEAMLATDLADYLVARGMPFREAHHVAGQVVRLSESTGTAFSALALADLQAISPLFEADVQQVWSFEAAVARRMTMGGTGDWSVQIHKAHAWLAGR